MKLHRQPQAKTQIKTLVETPSKLRTSSHINNLKEAKEIFLDQGKVLQLQFHGSNRQLSTKPKTAIRTEFLPEARYVLERTRNEFGLGDRFLQESFGEPLTTDEATKYITDYLTYHGLDGSLKVLWTGDLPCCGRMVWHGPHVRMNKPEANRYTLWLKSTAENVFLRKNGIKGLADHEIGTHFLRMRNECLQPWYSNRERFGVGRVRTYEFLSTEEGMATINSLLQMDVKLLWHSAFMYYAACMAQTKKFKELFEHLEEFVNDAELRWRTVMRVKVGANDCDDYGGTGHDQSYFAGAVKMLRQIETVDFKLLYSGKLTLEDLPRVKRIARQDLLKLPHFLKDEVRYKRTLRKIASLNGLIASIPNLVALQQINPNSKFPLMNAKKSSKDSQSTNLPPKEAMQVEKGMEMDAKIQSSFPEVSIPYRPHPKIPTFSIYSDTQNSTASNAENQPVVLSNNSCRGSARNEKNAPRFSPHPPYTPRTNSRTSANNQKPKTACVVSSVRTRRRRTRTTRLHPQSAKNAA